MNKERMEKAKEFITEHKSELIIAGISALALAGVVIVAGNKIKLLENACRLKDLEIMHLLEREAELVELCEAKDTVFNRVISDGLRHRSSEAARQMVFRKEYLQSA